MRKLRPVDDDVIIRFSPRSDSQKQLVESIWNNDITLVSGCAGSGKTGLSIQTLCDLLKQKYIRKIIVVRLIADTCDEHLGALPGEKDEKLLHFLGPILDNLCQIMKPGDLQYLLDKQQIEVVPVSHLRGRSFTETGILVEEAQNLSASMILTVLTRLGMNSKLVINGDPDQVDVRGRGQDNGIHYATQLLRGLEGAGVIHLPSSEVQRHPMIKPILDRARSLAMTQSTGLF